jgi:hypothetical protein
MWAAMNAPASLSARLHARNELARTSLLEAQHWFDHATELLAHGPLGDWQTLVVTVERHLIVAVASLRDGRAKSRRLVTQLDATTRAINGFWYAVLAWCQRHKLRADRTLERAMDRIYERIDQARALMELSEELGDAQDAHAARVDDVYQTRALAPVLELVRIEAEQALVELGGKDAMVTEIAEDASRMLERHVDYAVWLVDAGAGHDHATGDLVEAASFPVVALRRVIAERASTAELSARFDRVIGGLAALRMATCLAA